MEVNVFVGEPLVVLGRIWGVRKNFENCVPRFEDVDDVEFFRFVLKEKKFENVFYALLNIEIFFPLK